MYPPDEQMDSGYSFSPEYKIPTPEYEEEEWTPIDYVCPFCRGGDGEHKIDCPTNTHGAGF